MNDEKIINEIDFAAFEEAFKLNPVPVKKVDRQGHAEKVLMDGKRFVEGWDGWVEG